MDHEELVRRYSQSDEELSPEERAAREASRQYMQGKIARGEVLKSWSKENFPIGLDSNYEPFPLTGQDQEQGRDDDPRR